MSEPTLRGRKFDTGKWTTAGIGAALNDKKSRKAVLYSMKINNPRCDVEIATIDILPGIDDKGSTTNRAVPTVVLWRTVLD